MKLNQSEGILLEQYLYPDFLPPLWRIIFQEAMRGNHLIFSRSLQTECFEDSIRFSENLVNDDTLADFCANLYAAPDLRTIKSMISLLPKIEQKQLFHVYLRQMQSLREENKMSLN